MIIADTNGLVSLDSVDLLETVLVEFDVHTTETVIEELEDTGAYDDRHGEATKRVLDHLDRITVQETGGELTSSRVDPGEGSCALLANETDAAFLITDDLRALPELQSVTEADVAISPIVLKALVKRDQLGHEEAMENVEQFAEHRDWLDAPIYRRAKNLFE